MGVIISENVKLIKDGIYKDMIYFFNNGYIKVKSKISIGLLFIEWLKVVCFVFYFKRKINKIMWYIELYVFYKRNIWVLIL